jgi:ribosomal protein RSM22 (predicted rRNA methylase)
MEELDRAIESLVGAIPPRDLLKASETLSRTYREARGSRTIFENDAARIAYLAVRMPATFGAVSAVLRELPIAPSTWLDLGAGPGAASWAAAAEFRSLQSFTLIEKNPQAIAIGKELAGTHPLLQKGAWLAASLPIDLPPADAAILSYSLGEIERPAQLIDCWWKALIPYLIIVEPGTPRGFSVIKKARDQIISLGGFLVAPCPHAFRCPLKENDWCHFSVRIARSRLHRYLKGGTLGYEDEKYSYLIASKNPLPRHTSRILRHPQKNSGHVRLSLCTSSGNAEEITVGRAQEFYRKARNASWGDAWEPN